MGGRIPNTRNRGGTSCPQTGAQSNGGGDRGGKRSHRKWQGGKKARCHSTGKTHRHTEPKKQVGSVDSQTPNNSWKKTNVTGVNKASKNTKRDKRVMIYRHYRVGTRGQKGQKTSNKETVTVGEKKTGTFQGEK